MPKSRRPPRVADPARLPIVTDKFEAITEGDRRFFARHTDRSHRIRHTSQAWIVQADRAGSNFDRVLPGFHWFTVIRQVAPGCRVRVYLQALELCETDVPEAVAATIYGEAEGRKTRELTNDLVAALKKAGAL